MQGESLVKYLKNSSLSDDNAEAYTISYRESAASVIFGGWRYNRWGETVGEKNEELYNHLTDPEETVNLATNQKYLEKLKFMRNKLESARNKARQN